MPSIKLDLGKYVTLRRRKDGTYRVLFETPERVRPVGWLPTRPLPRQGSRTGNLNDPHEVARIIQDAKDLYAELEAARLGRPITNIKPFSIPDLVRRWQRSDRWTDSREDGGLAPRTQRFYQKVLNAHIIPWSASNNDPDVRKMTRMQVSAYLDLFKKKPYVQRQVRATLSTMLRFAVDNLGWMPTNPAADHKLRTPKKAKIVHWTNSDVDFYIETANEMGWVGGARLILALWETCARVTDAMVWRRGEHYEPATGRFTYDTEKTDEEVVDLPISLRLRAMFDEPVTLHLIFGPDGSPYKPVTDDSRLGDDFEKLRRRVVAKGGPHRVLRQLRHSAIKDATDAGASTEDVQGATAHASERTVKIYVRRSAGKAARVQKLRGII